LAGVYWYTQNSIFNHSEAMRKGAVMHFQRSGHCNSVMWSCAFAVLSLCLATSLTVWFKNIYVFLRAHYART